MLNSIKASCEKFADKNAFWINDQFYTYQTLAEKISKIRKAVEETPASESMIGFLTYDDIDTYSSVFGILYAGRGFVPINPENPLDRNSSVIAQAEILTVLTSRLDDKAKLIAALPGVKLIFIPELNTSPINLNPPTVPDDDTAYILFTSGSTGVPKGVPLTRKNLYSFMDAFFALGYDINENDRCLQMFDMTFDLSLMSYMAPLYKGACVYTVPPGGIKYTYVYSLLEDHQLTFALMVPSIISYLRPYFEEISLTQLKYSLFCGEALYSDITEEWQKCVPNALVQNVYGPTEATIFCLTYNLNSDNSKNKDFNGIVCIGKPMQNINAIVVDEERKILVPGEKGELCLTGAQLTPGYLKNPEKNREAFFTLDDTVYYRTGDLAYVDEEGDFMYCGRIDHQIKIQGFRVELSEIEHHVREFTKISNVAAVATESTPGNVKIILFLEDHSADKDTILSYLETKVPKYMIPSAVISLPSFPLNVNGKIDRKALVKSAAV